MKTLLSNKINPDRYEIVKNERERETSRPADEGVEQEGFEDAAASLPVLATGISSSRSLLIGNFSSPIELSLSLYFLLSHSKTLLEITESGTFYVGALL